MKWLPRLYLRLQLNSTSAWEKSHNKCLRELNKHRTCCSPPQNHLECKNRFLKPFSSCQLLAFQHTGLLCGSSAEGTCLLDQHRRVAAVCSGHCVWNIVSIQLANKSNSRPGSQVRHPPRSERGRVCLFIYTNRLFLLQSF